MGGDSTSEVIVMSSNQVLSHACWQTNQVHNNTGPKNAEMKTSHLCARESLQHKAHGVVADGAAATAVCECRLKATLRVEAFLGNSFAGEHVLRETPVLVLRRRLQ